MAEGNVRVADEGHRHRRPHPRGGGVLARALVDAPVGLLDQLGDAALSAARCGLVLADGAGGEARGELARLRAAHAVCDREQRGLDDVGVLVPPPLPARICAVAQLRNGHVSYLNSVSPTRTTSPGVSLRARVSLIPFRYVPFVEPTSWTHTPSPRGSIRACFAEA